MDKALTCANVKLVSFFLIIRTENDHLGFTGDGRTCVGDASCSIDCSSKPYSYCSKEGATEQCLCIDGFEEVQLGDEVVCRKICGPGYQAHGSSCYDINECSTSNHGCVNAYCDDTEGSYTCRCKTGFEAENDKGSFRFLFY